MKVLWVLKVLGVGGAERLLLELMPHFPSDIQFELVAIVNHPRDLEAEYLRHGVEPRFLGASSSTDFSWVRKLRRIIRDEKPDIVHLHNPLQAAGGRLALLGLSTANVYTEHNIWPSYHIASRWANAISLHRSGTVIAVSDGVRDSMLRSRLGRRCTNLVVVANGINEKHVRDDAGAQAGDTGVVEIFSEFPGSWYGAVGHLRFSKGVDVLMKASLLVGLRAPDAHAMVVGGGEDESALRAIQATLGSEVELLGDRHDARGLMSRMDVFVVPSRAEGLPLALLEAMSLGLPIVATRVGGIPSVLTHDHDALLVPTEDEVALAEAILRLLEDRAFARSIGEAARHTVTSRFSAKSTASKYVAAYRQVLGG